MSCSRDHPRTRRRLPFFGSNNRHSPESRAAISLDISVHAHGGSVLPIARVSRAQRRKGIRENRTARPLNCVETRKYYRITCTFNAPMSAHTRNAPIPSRCAPTQARSPDVFRALITNEIRSQTHTRRSISAARSVVYVLREALRVCTLCDDNHTNRTTPDRLRSPCNRGVASTRWMYA